MIVKYSQDAITALIVQNNNRFLNTAPGALTFTLYSSQPSLNTPRAAVMAITFLKTNIGQSASLWQPQVSGERVSSLMMSKERGERAANLIKCRETHSYRRPRKCDAIANLLIK